MLTVLVLYRAVRRVAGAGAGTVAALVLAGSPIVILLDRGNISDSLLILLLVLAADATIHACQTGRLRTLLWAGALVGLAFQAKMMQAWLVVPALFLAYLVAAPVASFLRRVWHLAATTLVVGVVSLSWMSVVSLVPQSSRPYADGSCDDSLFNQVFSYNGFIRLGAGLANTAGCSRPSTYLLTLVRYSNRESLGTGGIGPSWDACCRVRSDRRGLAAAASRRGGRLALRPDPPCTTHRYSSRGGVAVERLAPVHLRLLQRRPVLEFLLPCRADTGRGRAVRHGRAGRVGAPAPPPCALPWPFSRLPPLPSPSHSSRATSASVHGSSARPSWWACSLSSSSPVPCALGTIPSGPSASGPALRRAGDAARLVLGLGRRSCRRGSVRSTPRTRRPRSTPTPRRQRRTFRSLHKVSTTSSTPCRRGQPLTSSRHRARRATTSSPPGGSPPNRRIHRGRAQPDTPSLQADGDRGPGPQGHRRHQATDQRTSPALGGDALHEVWVPPATTRIRGPSPPRSTVGLMTRRAVQPGQSLPQLVGPRQLPSPARRKSRNCVTRMNRMMPRPIAGTCWRCRSFADYNNDGTLGLFVSDVKYHRLYSNSAQTGLFTDRTISASIAQVSGQYVGWGDNVFDFDNDGWKDIFVVNGGLHWLVPQEDSLLRNNGNGSFTDVSVSAGRYFQTKKVGRGACFADYDNDGLIDAFVVVLGGKGILLHAKPPAGVAPNHWLTLKLQGTRSNRDGFGARIVASAGDLQQTVVNVPQSGYLSSHDPRPHFGLGSHAAVDKLTIYWPSGVVQTLENVKADQFLSVVEPKQ